MDSVTLGLSNDLVATSTIDHTNYDLIVRRQRTIPEIRSMAAVNLFITSYSISFTKYTTNNMHGSLFINLYS
jgi:hypothetical protein